MQVKRVLSQFLCLVSVDSGDESDIEDEESESMNQSGEIRSHPKDLENHPRWKQQEDVPPECPVSPKGHVKAVRRNWDMTPQTPLRQSSKRFGFESSNEDPCELYADAGTFDDPTKIRI